jgi:hypothetical protein
VGCMHGAPRPSRHAPAAGHAVPWRECQGAHDRRGCVLRSPLHKGHCTTAGLCPPAQPLLHTASSTVLKTRLCVVDER